MNWMANMDPGETLIRVIEELDMNKRRADREGGWGGQIGRADREGR